MVTGDQQSIELKLTVDREDLERQLGQVIPSGAERAERAGGPQRPRRPQKVEPAGDFQKGMSQLTRLAGISLGITALVRSSKTMQATMGAFQQTMGAMVDSFLAPLMPHLMPLLEKLGGGIEGAAAAGQMVSDVVESMKAFNQGEFGRSGSLIERATRDMPERKAFEWMKERNLVPHTFDIPFFDLPGGGGGGKQRPAKTAEQQALRQASQMSDEELKRFIESRPNLSITINSANIDEIMSQVRAEVEAQLRDSQSQGPGGG